MFDPPPLNVVIHSQQPASAQQQQHIRCFADQAGWYRPPDPQPSGSQSASSLIGSITRLVGESGTERDTELASLLEDAAKRAPTLSVLQIAHLLGSAGKLAQNNGNSHLRYVAAKASRALAKAMMQRDIRDMLALASPAASGAARSLFSSLDKLDTLPWQDVYRLADDILSAIALHMAPAELVACLEHAAPVLGPESSIKRDEYMAHLVKCMPLLSLQGLSSLCMYAAVVLHACCCSSCVLLFSCCLLITVTTAWCRNSPPETT